MDFPPFGNSDHVVSVSIDFPSNSLGMPHFMAELITILVLTGLCDHLRDVPWEDIFKLGASAAACEFSESMLRLELMYICLIENIRSNLTRLHGFQLLVLLP